MKNGMMTMRSSLFRRNSIFSAGTGLLEPGEHEPYDLVVGAYALLLAVGLKIGVVHLVLNVGGLGFIGVPEGGIFF